jgi:sec-independent protein translocase protein TatC
MTLVEHLEELRTRIIRALIGLGVGMVIALILSQPVLQIIERPFKLAVGKPLTYTDMMVPFNVYMQIALYMGLVIGAPWIFYQIWMFIAAGLYKHERKYVVYAVPFSASLFIMGAMFFLFYVSPMLLTAFNIFNKWMGVEPMVTLDNHVTFMTNMMLVFGFCFQMPIAVLILGKMGLVTVKTLGRFRRHIIVAILILAAVLTGPSPLDQISLAIPMWMLYELGVLLVYFLVEKKRRAEDAAMGYEPLDD